MAQPMTPAQTVSALRKWQVQFVEVTGWETRNRGTRGNGFSDIRGFVIHHTGDDAVDSADLKVIIDGRSDLPGPLAQFGMDDLGVVHLVGSGRANHAGGGDPVVLAAVTHENYGDYPPVPRFHEGSVGATDGNGYFYGVETFYSGKRVPTAAAYASLVRLAAAICDFHGWSAKSVIGHKEWSSWKVDPGSVDMKVFRADVAAALKAGPAGKQTNQGQPTANTPVVLSTRVVKARASIQDALDLLNKAVDGGRTGAVQDVRDAVRDALKRLPKT